MYATLLRDRSYMAHILAGGLMISGMFAYIAASPFIFIELFHVAPERFGLFFGTNAFGLIAASQINGRLARRVHRGRSCGSCCRRPRAQDSCCYSRHTPARAALRAF